MKQQISLVASIIALLLLAPFALAPEPSATGSASLGDTIIKEQIVNKVPKTGLLRKVGGSRVYAPGQEKQKALEQSAKAFAPGQLKKQSSVQAARDFAAGLRMQDARKKQIFEASAKKLAKPHNPVKGSHKTYRGLVYKPSKKV